VTPRDAVAVPGAPRVIRPHRPPADARPAHEPTVLDVMPGLADAVEPRAVPVLRAAFLQRRMRLAAGAWLPAEDEPPHDVFAAVVTSGVLLRESRLGGRRHTEVLAPGDVTSPWSPADGLVPVEIGWRVLVPATLGLLDDAFLRAASRWPAMTACLSAAHAETCTRLATHKTICQLPRVEDRISHLLWHLADRLGKVRSDGVLLPLGLTHVDLGALVGAQRSTVTLALRQLAGEGVVQRAAEGGYLLRPGALPGAGAARAAGEMHEIACGA
jgi:CRP/FNR family cyclic AMP-dependent transcriptional regulator